jgi:anaerobic selenocysteine-containing dehydrogenase
MGKITRRDFLKSTAVGIAGLGIAGVPDWFKQASAEEKAKLVDKTVRSICGGCHNNCGILVYVLDGVIIYIEGDPNHPFNRGTLCPKGLAMLDTAYSPYRIKRPMKRVGERGEGKWQEITWDAALDMMAAKLIEIKTKYGAHTLLHSYGAPVMNVVRNAFFEFCARYGTPNTAVVNSVCYVPRVVALANTYGFRDEEDYKHTKLIVNWGANPFASMRPGSYMCYDCKGYLSPILDAKDRGVKLIVIDPVYSETASKADKWIPLRPGTDGALALAMISVIVKENLYDADFVRKWTSGFNELAAMVNETTPEWASKITGIPTDVICSLARQYATTKPAVIHEGNTFAMHTNCVQTTRAIGILRAITANLDVPGGNVCFPNVAGSINPVEIGSPNGGATTVKPPVPHLGKQKYPLLPNGFPVSIDAMETGKPYKPRAMITFHTNPLMIYSDYNRLKANLSQLDFIVVVDMFCTRTADELADLLLPSASFFEFYDYRTYPSEKGTVVALRQPAIKPLYESRDAYWIEYNLAKRMGLADGYPWTTGEEFINYALSPSKLTLDRLKKEPVQVVGEHKYRKYELGLLRKDGRPGFNTPSGKVELYSSNLKKFGYDPLPKYIEPAESPVSTPEIFKEYPLVGVSRRTVHFVHYKYRNVPYLRELHAYPEVNLHPQEASHRGLTEGEWVQISSPHGKAKMRLRISERVQPGVAWMDGGWGNSWDFRESNMNALVDIVNRDPISQSTATHSFLCQVNKA